MMRAWFLIVVLTAALSLAVFAQTMPPPRIWTDSALDRAQAGSCGRETQKFMAFRDKETRRLAAAGLYTAYPRYRPIQHRSLLIGGAVANVAPRKAP